MNIFLDLCALCVLIISIIINFSKKEDSSIVSALYMIIAWLMLIYNKIN